MREALFQAIAYESDLDVVGQLTNQVGALEMLSVTNPDVVMLALGNPGLAELDTLKNLCKAIPNIPILALTNDEAVGQDLAVLKCGAKAVLTIAAPRAEILRTLRNLGSKI